MTFLVLMSLAAILALMDTPALVKIAAFFHLRFRDVGWLLALYLLGYSFGQLFFAPFSIKWGRKKTLYAGLLLTIIASLSAGTSEFLHTFSLLMIARFFQGFGASSGHVMAFAIIQDVFDEHKSKEALSISLLGVLILPFTGIVVGGIILQYYHWSYIYYFSALYAALILFWIRKLPETTLPLPHLKYFSLLKPYVALIRQKRILLFSLLVGFMLALYYVFAEAAPVLGLHLMKLTALEYSLWNLVSIIGLKLGAVVVSIFSKKMKALTMIRLGWATMFLSALIILAFFLLDIIRPETFFLPMMFFFIGLVMIWVNGTTLTFEGSAEKAHVAALMSLINLWIGVLSLVLLTLLKIAHPLLLPLVFLSILIVVWIELALIRRLGLG